MSSPTISVQSHTPVPKKQPGDGETRSSVFCEPFNMLVGLAKVGPKLKPTKCLLRVPRDHQRGPKSVSL